MKVNTQVPDTEKVQNQTYLGLVEPNWKGRLANHTADFKHASRRGATCLSEYVWTLKEAGREYSITWAIMARAKSYSPTSDCCRLCVKEKSLMILYPEWATLNDRHEFFSHCRHKRKLLLSSAP